MSRVPVVVCFDLEPDRRVVDRENPGPLRGFEALVRILPDLRERLATTSGAPAHFTWTLRMDPQIADLYGTPNWIARHYEDALAKLQAEGDGVGLHTHNCRWRDEWVEDHLDDEWIAHCVETGLDAFRNAFGRPCEIYRHGDFFLSTEVVNQIAKAGVSIDLTVEEGLAPATGPEPARPDVSVRPDVSGAPHHAYRPSVDDFRVPNPSRDTQLVLAPLTPGLAITTEEVSGRVLPTGRYQSLTLTDAPDAFAAMLRIRLRQPDLTHLAFAVRAETALAPDSWEILGRNADEVGRQLAGREFWCNGVEAADQLASLTEEPGRNAEAETDPERAAIWANGAQDMGYLAGAEPEGLAVLARVTAGLVDGFAPDDEAVTHDEVAAPLRWVDEESEVTCPVCGISGTAARILVARADWKGGIETGVLRCGYCRALVLERAPGVVSDLPEAAIDEYIEYGAGIDSMLMMLSAVEPRPGLRFLDVGCGYGFALDLSRFAWGWEGIGLDPWNLAARGRDDLELDIRSDVLGPELDLGREPFDVVLASECVEHVGDPLAFLRELRSRVRDDGIVLISTPDADSIRPDEPAGNVIARLGLGGHVFLVDAEGLERLLRRAGFAAVTVTRDAGALRAAASPSAPGLARTCAVAGADLALLARYCDARAAAAPRNSALRTGMAARTLRYALHLADFATAEATTGRLRDALLARHGIDLDDPEATARRAVVSSAHRSMVAGEAHFDLGVLELLARERPERAVAHFRAAAAVARAAPIGPSPEPVHLELRALGHAALALARTDPGETPAALGRLAHLARSRGAVTKEVDDLARRVFTELVAGGHYEPAEAARPLVRVPERAADGDVIDRVALDALFSIAMLALHHGRPAEAAAYFGLCTRLARSSGLATDVDLAETARVHEVMALDTLGASVAEVRPAIMRSHVEVRSTRLGVTAVLPVYNGRRHLHDALASVVAQTEPPDEVIVVDDGSSDGSLDVLDHTDAPFPIRVVHQDRVGQSAARNRAIELAGGELIAFLDQDDGWHPEHLAALCTPLRDDPTVGWVYSDFDEIDADGRTVTLSFLREHGIVHPRSSLAACLTEDLMVIPSASVLRRRTLDAVGGFDEMLQGFEDDDLFVRTFRAGWGLVFDTRSLTRFRVHPGSSSVSGRFAESRRYYGMKLQDAVADDRRLNRFYFRDVVAPRFFRATLDDYVRAVSEKNWEVAEQAWADLEHFARQRRDHGSLRWKVMLIRNPRRFRRMLQLNTALPASVRPAKNPVLALREA